ncbi:MAG: hypothetical protein ACI4ET_13135 [Bilifractor sp.]
MEISEFEKKRAANLIWNGAENYDIEPGFRVFDSDGRADLYWNSIVGAVHKHYDWEKLESFYNTFHEKVDQTAYESLFWLAMENCTFQRERDVRPVFPYLRREYAKRHLKSLEGSFSLEDSAGQRVLAVTRGHFRRALGENEGLPDVVDVKLLNSIEVSGDLDTDQVISQIADTLETFFTYRRPGSKKPVVQEEKKSPFLLLFFRRSRKGRTQDMGPVRRLAFGYGEHLSEYGGAVLDQSHLSVSFAKYSAQTDEGLREYITDYFGKPLYDQKQVRKLEKEYCTGNHTDVHLHFTDGAYDEEMLKKGFAGKMRKEAVAQAKENEKAYQENITRYNLSILRLTNQIRNSRLMRMDDQQVKSNSGRLDASLIWRGLELKDDRVFRKVLPGNTGNLTVDILLDASTSQVHRQPVVAAQGYMIAESLTRCGIPVRVYSFCSMNGYTVVNMFRDYNEPKNNRNIFRYFTTGANRDGLAIRLAAGMMKNNPAEYRLLIVLSDGKPNDAVKVRTSSGIYRDYAGSMGVEDTAAEVHRARMQGITVLCVFTGDEKSLPSVQRIYGRQFARIRQLDLFADTVGSMLQTCLRNI